MGFLLRGGRLNVRVIVNSIMAKTMNIASKKPGTIHHPFCSTSDIVTSLSTGFTALQYSNPSFIRIYRTIGIKWIIVILIWHPIAVNINSGVAWFMCTLCLSELVTTNGGTSTQHIVQFPLHLIARSRFIFRDYLLLNNPLTTE